jgi:hypothetical protein
MLLICTTTHDDDEDSNVLGGGVTETDGVLGLVEEGLLQRL